MQRKAAAAGIRSPDAAAFDTSKGATAWSTLPTVRAGSRQQQGRSATGLAWAVGTAVTLLALLWITGRLSAAHAGADPKGQGFLDDCPPCKCERSEAGKPRLDSPAECPCPSHGGPTCANNEVAKSRLVVLAAHDEDYSWAFQPDIKVPVKVYTNANNTSTPITKEVLSGPGREARTYLAAILDNWDNLPDAMVFMHAHRESWHSYLGDSLRTDGAWRLKNLRWLTQEPYVDLTCKEPVADMGILRTDLASPSLGRNISAAWQEHFKHYLGLRPPKTIVTPCCAQFLATRRAILKHPREFYEDTIKWLDTTTLGVPEQIVEYLWQIMFSRRHRGTYAWAYLPHTCTCYLYGLGCDHPDTLFHLNPAEPPRIW